MRRKPRQARRPGDAPDYKQKQAPTRITYARCATRGDFGYAPSLPEPATGISPRRPLCPFSRACPGMSASHAIWLISALTLAGILLRPARLPEWAYALAGAAALVLGGLLSVPRAWHAMLAGSDVYLFLAGMMLLSEVAARHGVFDFLAACAVHFARGSPRRLLLLVYGVGTCVTILMSNDATAVVLTPAVLAATRAAKARTAIPYLLSCALVANAASFVLPISNPANIVLFGAAMPPLREWLARFALPSLAAIVVTFIMLRISQRSALRERLVPEIIIPRMTSGTRAALASVIGAAALLLAASACGQPLGWPAFGVGVLSLFAVNWLTRAPWQGCVACVKRVSWGVLPLVAGLFIAVDALRTTGAAASVSRYLEFADSQGATAAAFLTGTTVALVGNLVNNLPAGLLAASALHGVHLRQSTLDAVVIGIDLGPNLSVTGSLATLLWLIALRRAGVAFSGWRFLKVGALTVIPALAAALASVVALAAGAH